jgi:ATP-binding protein involved in chromosome partitioning
MQLRPKGTDTRIAIPTSRGVLSAHFGHCEQFTFIDVRNSQMVYKTAVEAPPHEPGSIPQWLSENGANVIIAGGMGIRAQQFFDSYGIQVVIGAPSLTPEEVVEQFVAGTLQTGANACDGDGHGMGTGDCGSRGGGGAGGGRSRHGGGGAAAKGVAGGGRHCR